ncbi:MAG: COX15/CtaA family protein, partial [Pseudomonadota bacterium]
MIDSTVLAQRSSFDADKVHTTPPTSRLIAVWLLLCCAMLFAMVVIGGVTRLTHSGLSIVEWQPFIGTIPPLNDAEWQAMFQKYQL